MIKLKLVDDVAEIDSPDDEELLERVWLTYGEQTANALEALTHTEQPWKEAREGLLPNERSHIAIDPETMKSYYRSIYNDGEE